MRCGETAASYLTSLTTFMNRYASIFCYQYFEVAGKHID